MLRWMNQKRVLSFILIALSLWIILYSRTFASKHIGAVNASFFPTLIAGILIGLAVILFIQSIWKTAADVPKFFPDKEEMKKIGLYSGVIILYLLVVSKAGFVLTSIVFLFVMFTLLGSMSVIRRMIVSVLITYGIYFLFHKLLHVMLPTWSF